MAADSVQPGGLKERRGREELIEIFFHQLWAHDSLCETQHILDFTAPPFRPAFSGPLWKPYRCMAFLTQMYGNLLQRNRAPSFCRLWNFGSNFVTFSVIRVWLRCVCMCVFVCLCVCVFVCVFLSITRFGVRAMITKFFLVVISLYVSSWHTSDYRTNFQNKGT